MKNTNQSSNESNQPEYISSNGRNNNSTAKTLVAIAAGAAAGAVTALLLTPKTGTETRQAIKRGASQLKDTMSDSIKQGIDRFSGKIEQAMASADRIKEEVTAKQGTKMPEAKANNA